MPISSSLFGLSVTFVRGGLSLSQDSDDQRKRGLSGRPAPSRVLLLSLVSVLFARRCLLSVMGSGIFSLSSDHLEEQYQVPK